MAFTRELDNCIFCGTYGTTEEHLIAKWVFRAFLRVRRPTGALSGTFLGDGGRMRVEGSEPITTAKVVCERCNNEWMSGIDNAAAKVLKPVIRGDHEVVLDRNGQSAVAAWVYKSAIMFDASTNGNDGELVSLREGLKDSRQAPPGCRIFVGPAGPPTRFTLPGIPEVAGLRMFGVRKINGVMRLTVNVTSVDGATTTPGTPKNLPIPGWQILLGSLNAYIGGRIPAVQLESLPGYVEIWPTHVEEVTVQTTLRGPVPPAQD